MTWPVGRSSSDSLEILSSASKLTENQNTLPSDRFMAHRDEPEGEGAVSLTWSAGRSSSDSLEVLPTGSRSVDDHSETETTHKLPSDRFKAHGDMPEGAASLTWPAGNVNE